MCFLFYAVLLGLVCSFPWGLLSTIPFSQALALCLGGVPLSAILCTLELLLLLRAWVVEVGDQACANVLVDHRELLDHIQVGVVPLDLIAYTVPNSLIHDPA